MRNTGAIFGEVLAKIRPALIWAAVVSLFVNQKKGTRD